MPTQTYSKLTDRGFLRVEGPDAEFFLQGLITNDITKATKSQALYSCMLTAQGKFFADFFILQWPVSSGSIEKCYLLECHRKAVGPLETALKHYKLRSKVTINEVSDQWSAYACSPDRADGTVSPALAALAELLAVWGIAVFLDPRLPALGSRQWVPVANQEVFHRLMAPRAKVHHAALQRRIRHAVPEGVSEMQEGKSFPHEWGMDLLHAIDYEKGCYLGQELTARTKYRGTVRKAVYHIATASLHSQLQLGQLHLEPGPQPLQPGSEIFAGEQKIGELYSCFGQEGIALLRIEEVAAAMEKQLPLTALGVEVIATPAHMLRALT